MKNYVNKTDGRRTYKTVVSITTNGNSYYFFSRNLIRSGFNYNNVEKLSVIFTYPTNVSLITTIDINRNDGYVGLYFNRSSSGENVTMLFSVTEKI